jgi:fatty-acid desaturase
VAVKHQRAVDISMAVILTLAMACWLSLLAVIFAPVIDQAAAWIINAAGFPK